MRLLLDTHVFLWWVDASPELSAAARRAIARPGNECFVSIVSCWEMAIKASLGKLRLSETVERFVPEQLALNNFLLLPMEFHHAARTETLPFHRRDPFDRLLVAQAMSEKMVLVTADPRAAGYGVKCLW